MYTKNYSIAGLGQLWIPSAWPTPSQLCCWRIDAIPQLGNQQLKVAKTNQVVICYGSNSPVQRKLSQRITVASHWSAFHTEACPFQLRCWAAFVIHAESWFCAEGQTCHPRRADLYWKVGVLVAQPSGTLNLNQGVQGNHRQNSSLSLW